MNAVLAKYSASISELKRNSTKVIKEAEKEQLSDKIEDYELGLIVRERQEEKSQAIEVSLNDL